MRKDGAVGLRGARGRYELADLISRPVVYVQQACTHPVQLHGLCGICGKELTE